MATLQATAHFWTTRDDVIISDCDLGAFKYQLGKDSDLLTGPYGNLKRLYCETRDKNLIPTNKRPNRLKDTLLEFEEILGQSIVIHIGWATVDYGSCMVIFNNGIIAHLIVDLSSSSLKDVAIDRSLEGKLPAEIVNVAISPNLLVIAHGIPQLTLISAGHPLFFIPNPCHLSMSTVTVNSIQLPGPGSRRHEKKVSIAPSNEFVCVWWEREGGELFAWAPIVRAEDRANILIYLATSCELTACFYTEYSPLSVEFSAKDKTLLRVAELLTSPKGRLTVRFTAYTYEQTFTPMVRRVLKIPSLPKCYAHSPDEQFMLLGCVDASLVLWDITKDSCTIYKASFIPFHLAWHGTSSFFTVCSDRGQLQCYDRALNPLLLRLQKSGDGTPVAHLQQYLRNQPSVLIVKWPASPQIVETKDSTATKNAKTGRMNRKKRAVKTQENTGPARIPTHHLLVCFERGPVVCLQVLTSCWPASCLLDSYALCTEYLQWQQLEAAVQHVLSLNWNKVITVEDEDNILKCFIRLVNGLLLHSSPAADGLLERVVTRVLDALKGQDSLVESVYDAARRCCRMMLRRKQMHLAASYALRLQDMDLVVELILHARKQNDEGLVTQATAVLDCLRDEFSSSSSTSSRTSSSYTSSGSSCSTCDDTHSSAPAQELSNLNIEEDTSEDQVHVISFGVV